MEMGRQRDKIEETRKEERMRMREKIKTGDMRKAKKKKERRRKQRKLEKWEKRRKR
jgi:hypothetical protein